MVPAGPVQALALSLCVRRLVRLHADLVVLRKVTRSLPRERLAYLPA